MGSLIIRVILDTKEDIFRDIELPADASLETLHEGILSAFGIAPGEMAAFYTTNEQWDQLNEIPLLDMGPSEEPLMTMNLCPVNSVLGQRGQRLLYVFDFMALWTFFVEYFSEGKNAEIALPAVVMSYGNAPKEAPSKNFGSSESKEKGLFDDAFDDEEEDDEEGFNDDEFDADSYSTEEW